MGRFVFLIIVLCFYTGSWGQDISLAFKGLGVVSSVDRVEVANLDNGSTLNISGLDILQLVVLPDYNPDDVRSLTPVVVRPEMRLGSCEIELSLLQSGVVEIEVLNATGIRMLHEHFHLADGDHIFHIKGMKTGAHRIIITTPNQEHSQWIMSGNNKPKTDVVSQYIKGSGATRLVSYNMPTGKSVTMPYRRGQRLLLKATTGSYESVVVLVPGHDQIVEFRFAPCIDADGNRYSVVNIGNQLWMAENLKTTRFSDGSPILYIEKEMEWRENAEPAFCWYDNNESYRDWYGGLYNWYVVESGNVCPQGWRMPDDADWYEFEIFIDSTIQIHTALGWRGSHGGASLKASSGWSDGQNGFNAFGFTALPAGRRGHNGHFNSGGQYAYWWTATMDTEGKHSWSRYILPNYEFFYRGSFLHNYGFSIRCIME
jgi:uncharacterized protein (TIGR02145 family)